MNLRRRRGARPWTGALIVAFGIAAALSCAPRAPVSAAAAGPPREAGTFREPDLVELTDLDATIRLDVRYATSNNFVGRPVYREPRAFLQRPAAEALVRAHEQLAGRGFGVLVFDGYRPWSVTKLFWETATPEQRERGFVANPAKGSKHNRGCAVDLTLYDRATGREVEMPSAYDEFTDRADPDYAGGTPPQTEHRDLLRAAMEREGFTVDPGEWWHFNYRDWERYPILDVPFGAIE